MEATGEDVLDECHPCGVFFPDLSVSSQQVAGLGGNGTSQDLN